MSSLDGDNMETTQELALMVLCTMMSQLDDDDRNALAQEIIDSRGVPHLIKAMFGSNTAVAASAKETLIQICETAASASSSAPPASLSNDGMDVGSKTAN